MTTTLEKWLIRTVIIVSFVLVIVGVFWETVSPLRASCRFYNLVARQIVPPTSMILLFLTIWVSLKMPRMGVHTRAILLGLWLVAPPLWLAFEYTKLFLPLYQSNMNSMNQTSMVCERTFETFKYGQDVTAKVWAAVVLFLGALYFKSHDS